MKDVPLKEVATTILITIASADAHGVKVGEAVPALSFSHPVDFCVMPPHFMKAVLDVVKECERRNKPL